MIPNSKNSLLEDFDIYVKNSLSSTPQINSCTSIESSIISNKIIDAERTIENSYISKWLYDKNYKDCSLCLEMPCDYNEFIHIVNVLRKKFPLLAFKHNISDINTFVNITPDLKFIELLELGITPDEVIRVYQISKQIM